MPLEGHGGMKAFYEESGLPESYPLVSNYRLHDPAIAKLLLHIRAANVVDPEYTAIKRILEWGVKGAAVGLDAIYAKQQSEKVSKE